MVDKKAFCVIFFENKEVIYNYTGGKYGWDKIGSGWWTGNTLEPEVVYVDGVYHMLLQSSGTTQSGWYGDYINYASSTDGVNFERKIDSPVINHHK